MAGPKGLTFRRSINVSEKPPSHQCSLTEMMYDNKEMKMDSLKRSDRFPNRALGTKKKTTSERSEVID
ncbi:hypothetical protein [Paenibacillus prosopidis]|uniref:hypothetical protein n=1 Tax=Paenibacillus prosopidis TaxID=630520 RepID=UPI000DF253F6|nr:hypothetical protein [Paenibacillus prosopidis]